MPAGKGPKTIGSTRAERSKHLPGREALEALLRSIHEYRDRLRRDPSLKEEPLSIPESGISLDAFAAIATTEAEAADNSFDLFAIAKHGLTLSRSRGDYVSLSSFFPRWLYVCVNAGAYQECIDFCRSCVASSDWDALARTKTSVAVLRNQAKSLRNLGHFEESLGSYRASIERARALDLPAEITIGLLLIGKLYGTYLGQQGLFWAFVEEALNDLERRRETCLPEDREHLIRYLAICHDALGQVYRETDYERALHHFREAIRLNRSIRRPIGISRALCHLSYFNFMSVPEERYLRWFQHGIRLLQDDRLEERGLGVRWIQYAAMLNRTGQHREAEECLIEGKRIAIRYSDYKSIVRACLGEAALLSAHDPDRALAALIEGRRVAQSHNLLLYESSINREIAELSVRTRPESLETIVLFQRNREIHIGHLEKVKANLQRLRSAAGDQEEEFKLLSQKTRDDFRQRLLLDFERIVNELDLNIHALTGTLMTSEDRRHELLVLGVVNSVARELLHEVKLIIPIDERTNLFDAAAAEIEDVAAALQPSLAETGPGLAKSLEGLRSRLSIQATKIRALEASMKKLKRLLGKQLQRPRVLNEEVSLRRACKQAIEEIKEQSADSGLPELDTSCDVILPSNQQLVVLVVKNLIRNALDERVRLGRAQDVIRVRLEVRPTGDPKYGNPAKMAFLSIVSLTDSETVARGIAEALRRGLAGEPSDKAFSSGVGLDLTRTVFRDLMGSSIDVLEEGLAAGIRVGFSLGTDLIKVVPD